MVSKAAIGIAAGICGTLFIGYCIYFDRKRRSDPNFKKKIRESKPAFQRKIAYYSICMYNYCLLFRKESA